MISFKISLSRKKYKCSKPTTTNRFYGTMALSYIYIIIYIYIPMISLCPIGNTSLYQVPGGLRGCCPGPSAGGGWIDGNWGGSWGYKVVIAMELPSSHRCPLASHVDPKKTQIYIPDQLFFFLDLTCLPIPLYNIDICVIHIFMHACMHAYIHTNMHACIHTYRHTYIQCRQTDIHTYIQTHRHTTIQTDIHTDIHTDRQTDRYI